MQNNFSVWYRNFSKQLSKSDKFDSFTLTILRQINKTKINLTFRHLIFITRLPDGLSRADMTEANNPHPEAIMNHSAHDAQAPETNCMFSANTENICPSEEPYNSVSLF